MVYKIGHRGAKAYPPENTIKSFNKAIESGADGIEFDLRQTKDGKIIVFHDCKLDRLTSEKGLVREYPLEKIKSLQVGGEPIPTLREALEAIDKRVEKIIIEIKEAGIEQQVLKEIKEKGLEDRVIITSFLKRVLENTKKEDSTIERGWIHLFCLRPIRTGIELGVEYLLPFYWFATEKYIEMAHKKGMKVLVWTVNSQEKAKKYTQKGAEGIITDKPDIEIE